MVVDIKHGKTKKEDIERRLEEIFGQGSRQELEGATAMDKIIERIEQMSKREAQFDKWEKMRQDFKRRQREDRRLNLFWRRNKTFPAQYGGDEETPEVEETMEFWRIINNKETSEM